MFNDDWFRRRKKHSPYDIFDEIERMEKLMWKIVEKFISKNNFRSTFNKKPFIYGFSISTGQDGKPIIREFGNINTNLNTPLIKEEFEPLIDIIEEEKAIKIYVELPGMKKENIKLRLKSVKLIISAKNENRKYYKEIDLPLKVNVENIRAKYRNGVLEVIISKNEKL